MAAARSGAPPAGSGAPALKSIGVIDACVAAGFPHDQVTLGTPDGEVFGVGRSPQVAGPDYPPSVALTRPALHRVLTQAVAATKTTVRLGVTVESFHDHDRGVDWSFRTARLAPTTS